MKTKKEYEAVIKRALGINEVEFNWHKNNTMLYSCMNTDDVSFEAIEAVSLLLETRNITVARASAGWLDLNVEDIGIKITD